MRHLAGVTSFGWLLEAAGIEPLEEIVDSFSWPTSDTTTADKVTVIGCRLQALGHDQRQYRWSDLDNDPMIPRRPCLAGRQARATPSPLTSYHIRYTGRKGMFRPITPLRFKDSC
jgi:hypothetical protein